MRRPIKLANRLRNLEARVGSDLASLEFEGGAALAIPMTTGIMLRLVARCMALRNAVLRGKTIAPDRDDRLIRLFANSARATGKNAECLRRLARYALDVGPRNQQEVTAE